MIALGLCLASGTPRAAEPLSEPLSAPGARLLEAYPEALDHFEGGTLVWRDGTRMPLQSAGLDEAGIADMIAVSYPAFGPLTPPAAGSDPGRARNAAFFLHMYGDCRRGEVERNLVAVDWLPRKAHQRVRVTTRNGVARRLQAVSSELDALPAAVDVFLKPAAGGYNCRMIAGEHRLSAHAYGIAFDIARVKADYWRWGGGGSRATSWRNGVPPEIVTAFERQGFIWGGRWSHFDTMHFEYRPELFPARSAP